jgi:DNA-binding XRE family transcriptional regulator
MKQLLIKIRNSSKLSSIDIGRIIDLIKTLINNIEIEIKEPNYRY